MTEQFDSILQQLNRINYINNGGCGISTLAQLNWIEKFEPYLLDKCKVIIGYNEWHNYLYEQNENSLMNGGRIAVPAHVYLKIDGIRYDSKGEMYRKLPMEHEIAIDPGKEILTDMINNPSYLAGWNDWFDRSEEVPRIEAMLDIDLSIVKL